MSSPRVAIIIINWNGRQHLENCLPSLAAQRYRDFEIILVDNGSTDDSLAWVRSHFPHIRVLENASNQGFAAPNNQAICASQSEFVVLLNNDTVADPNWLATLVAVADRDPTIGMVASKMLLAERPGIIDSAGIALDRSGLAWGIAAGQPDLPVPPGTMVEVFGASGGAALYRRAMLDEIGLFDEDFFAYLEDVDLAWRAQWAGWRAVYAADAVVEHHHSATSNRIPHFKSRLLGRNKLWLLAKNYPFPHLLWYLPLIASYELMSLARAAYERRLSSALAGRINALRHLPAMWAKRRTQIRRRSARSMLDQLHPVVSPWQTLQRYTHVPSMPTTESEYNP